MARHLRPALLAASLALAGLAACHDGSEPPGAPTPDGVVATVDLRAAADRADVTPVGVAADDRGNRFVFDERAGLFRLVGDRLELALAHERIPSPNVVVRLPFTDLVALGADRFAITAVGDGFLLDLALETMRVHFCYEPGGGPPPTYEQRTNSVAYDPATRLLYANPRTFDDDRLVASQIATFSAETGEDLEWFDVRLELNAGGMAIVPGIDGVVLGTGPMLRAFAAGRITDVAGLGPLGVRRIEGLAYDAMAGTLLVVDGETDRLLELDLDALLGR